MASMPLKRYSVSLKEMYDDFFHASLHNSIIAPSRNFFSSEYNFTIKSTRIRTAKYINKRKKSSVRTM